MRILVISNFYPPARAGGYTQWCHEVTAGLRARGHEIHVLTSSYNLAATVAGSQPHVHRLLHLDGDLEHYRPLAFFGGWRRRQQENAATVQRVVADYRPDLIFVWGLWAMSRDVARQAELALPGRVVYYLSDYWPADPDMHRAYWQLPANRPLMQPVKRLLRQIARRMMGPDPARQLTFPHAICVSRAVRDILVSAGIPVQQARVIHGGTDSRRFAGLSPRSFADGAGLRMLYAGQLVPHKGVHTLVEAMAILQRRRTGAPLHLTIVGSGRADYEAALRRRVADQQLQDMVTFAGPVEKEEMPAVLAEANVLLFPSVYEEPFARMTQEAMLAGLAVIGTLTGGTPELLREGETGLTFGVERPDELAQQIERLLDEPALAARLAQAGQAAVLAQFTLPIMLERIETYLLEIVAESGTQH